MLMTWLKIKNDLVKWEKYSEKLIEFSNDKGKNLLLDRIMNCKNREQRMLT